MANMRDVQEKYKESVVGLCLVCGKPCFGWYARFGNEGVCSKKCMTVQDAKPKYPGFSEEEFLKRQGESFDVDSDIINQGE